MLVPALTLPVRGATLFVATMPVPASPSGGQNGMPGCSVPVGVEPLRPLDGQHTGVLACGQNGRQQFDKIHGAALLVCQRVKFCEHCGIIPAGGAVNREHAAGIAFAQHLAPGQLPVYIACQRGEKVQLRQVWLAVQHGLVQVCCAPPLRDVEPER